MIEHDGYVTDALIVCDGFNPSFFAYIPIEIAQVIYDNGLACSEGIILRETEDRMVPERVKNGTAEIIDVQVKMEANKCYNLN